MRRLYLCRHGESVLNAQGIYAGRIDTPLTDLGRSQAALAGQDAVRYKIDLIVSSPLVRALETAQIVAGVISYPVDKIIVNDLFQERDLGQLEGRPWSDAPEDEILYPDIESQAALVIRARAGLEFLNKLPADNILLVSHGSFLKALTSEVSSTPDTAEPPNAKITQVI